MVIFPLFLKSTGMGEGDVGKIIGISALAGGILAVPATYLIERVGRRSMLIVATLTFLVASLLTILFVTSSALPLFVLFVGASQVFTQVSMSPFISTQGTFEDRPYFFGVMHGVSISSLFLGNFISGILSDLYNGPMMVTLRDSYAGFSSLSGSGASSYALALLTLLPAALFSVIALLLIQDKAQKVSKTRVYVRNLKRLLGDRKLYVQLAYSLVIGFGAGMVVPFFSLFLSHKLHASNTQVGTTLAVSQLMVALGAVLTPFLVTKWGMVKTVVIVQMASIPFLLGIALPDILIVAAAAVVIRGALMNMPQPVNSNFLMQIFEERERGIVMGLDHTASAVTRALALVAGGYLMEHVSYEAPYFFTVALYIVGTLIYFFGFSRLERALPQPLKAILQPRPGFASESAPPGADT